MKNKFILLLTLLLICGSISGLTLWKVNNNHQEKLIAVAEKRIIEAFEKCRNNEQCLTTKVTLKELQEKGFLNQEINPITKTYYNELSYVTLENNTPIFKEQ